VPVLTLVGSNQLIIDIPIGTPSLSLEIRASSATRLRLTNAQHAAVDVRDFAASPLPQTFAATIPKPGSYWLDLRTGKIDVTNLKFPAGVGVELEQFRIPKAVPVPDLYFFVPSTEPAVALYDAIALPEGSGPSLRDASGAAVPVERLDGGRLLVARVPPGQAGRIWTLRRAVAPDSSLRLLNVPQRLALSPRALRVPSDALAGAPRR
jgi:hypothetical protein